MIFEKEIKQLIAVSHLFNLKEKMSFIKNYQIKLKIMKICIL